MCQLWGSGAETDITSGTASRRFSCLEQTPVPGGPKLLGVGIEHEGAGLWSAEAKSAMLLDGHAWQLDGTDPPANPPTILATVSGEASVQRSTLSGRGTPMRRLSVSGTSCFSAMPPIIESA